MMFKQFITALAVIFAAGTAISGEKPVTFAERSAAVEITGTITEIDKIDRLFRVSDDHGATVFHAGEDVRNFDQIEVGDRINIAVIRSVAVAMVDSLVDEEPNTTELVARAKEGEKPGGAEVEILTVVVEFISYDADSFVATIKTPKDEVLKIVVKPEIRDFANSRKPGDRIAVAMTQALAISVETVK